MIFLLKSMLFVLIADFYLYWQHRGLHRFLPKQHAIHHKYKYAIVMHPIEHFLNWAIFPIGWFLSFSFFETVPVAIWGIAYTLMAHERVKGSPGNIFMSALDHEGHHDKYDKNYGVLFTFWDRLIGSYSR